MILFLAQAIASRVLFTQMAFFWRIERSISPNGAPLPTDSFRTKEDILWLIAVSWLLIGPVILISFAVYLFTKFDAALCNVDGWRIAKLQEGGNPQQVMMELSGSNSK